MKHRLARIAVAGIAIAALGILAACTTSSDDQQQQQESVAQQEESAAPASTTAAPSRSSSAAPAAEADAAQEQEEQAVAEEDQAQEAADSEGMESGMTVPVLAAAEYDSLSPRLQLLSDAGYPVYVSEMGYTIALGTPDLSPGRHRVSVVIEGPIGLVEFPALKVIALRDGAMGKSQEVVARFARFPDGVRGFHVTEVEFDSAGRWSLLLQIPSANGFDMIGIAVDVPEDTTAPSVGDAAVPSASRTLTDVGNISDLSTGANPDPGLYLISLADAVAAEKPFVVVFASPGFCTNAFCGPQAQVLSEIRASFGDAANYVHVDLYENPDEVKLGADPVETPILEEWGLHTDEWTFVVNADGTVFARFEAFAPYDEVEAALMMLLEG